MNFLNDVRDAIADATRANLDAASVTLYGSAAFTDSPSVFKLASSWARRTVIDDIRSLDSRRFPRRAANDTYYADCDSCGVYAAGSLRGLRAAGWLRFTDSCGESWQCGRCARADVLNAIYHD